MAARRRARLALDILQEPAGGGPNRSHGRGLAAACTSLAILVALSGCGPRCCLAPCGSAAPDRCEGFPGPICYGFKPVCWVPPPNPTYPRPAEPICKVNPFMASARPLYLPGFPVPRPWDFRPEDGEAAEWDAAYELEQIPEPLPDGAELVAPDDESLQLPENESLQLPDDSNTTGEEAE